VTREELLELHDEVCSAAKETMARKNHDYTSNAPDPFANFRGASFVGVHPVIGILMRTMDKFKRIQTFVERGELRVDGEGVRDAVEDSVNYLILAYGIILEEGERNAKAKHVLDLSPPGGEIKASITDEQLDELGF